MKIKTIEVSTQFGGVISEAPYENVKPGYTDKIIIDIDENDDEVKIREQFRNALQFEQIRAFDLLKNRLKAELVSRQFQKVNFREKDGKQYPSVTSITGWAKEWQISDTDLQQYAARGTIVHYMIEQFIKTGAWLDLKAVAEAGYREEAAIMFRGSLGLRVEDCTHQDFFAEFGEDFQFEDLEVEIFNDQYLFSGRFDAVGTYKGIKSIIDFKTGSSWEFKQLAAYANGDGIEGIEQLVICPVGPNNNKSGVKKPVVSKNIKTEFDYFLRDRAEFTKRFGI